MSCQQNSLLFFQVKAGDYVSQGKPVTIVRVRLKFLRFDGSTIFFKKPDKIIACFTMHVCARNSRAKFYLTIHEAVSRICVERRNRYNPGWVLRSCLFFLMI